MTFFWGVSDAIVPRLPAVSPTTLPPHPRTWMTPTRLAFIQLQMTNNTTTWKNVKKIADAQVARGTAFVNSGGNKDIWEAGELGLAYLCTGLQSYATRAEVILTNFCGSVGTTDIRTDSCFYYRETYVYATQLFDWCYNGLSVACRQQAATWLMDSADYVWPQTNPSTTAYHPDDPQSNYNWGFLATIPAAIAAAGDDTGTGSVSGANRPAYHLALGQSKLNTIDGPPLDEVNFMKGGAWGEGTGYDSSGRVGVVFVPLNDLGMSYSTPFTDNALLFHFHATMPGFAFRVPYGDQASTSSGAVSGRNVVEQLMALSSNSTLKAQAQFYLNTIGGIPTEENGSGLLPVELLYYNPAASAATDLSALSLYNLAQGPGFFEYRNSWTDPNSTAFTFESGIVGVGHGGENCNGFRIWKGAYWLSGDANIYSASGINKQTQYYNNLTLAGVNQPLNGQNLYPIPYLRQTPSSTVVVIDGQGKTAYGLPSSRTITNYLRTVVYVVAKDTFIIVDNVTATVAASQKVFRWHMKNTPVIGSTTFTLSNPAANYHGYGQVHLPSSGVTLSNEVQSLGSGGAASSNAVKVALATGNTTDLTVQTIQLSSGGSAPYSVSASSDGTNVTVLLDTLTITIPLDGTTAVTVT